MPRRAPAPKANKSVASSSGQVATAVNATSRKRKAAFVAEEEHHPTPPKRPNTGPEEKRLKTFRKHAPKTFLEKLGRSQTQRMIVIGRTRGGTDACPTENIDIVGTTGNIYKVTIDKVPSCTCPDSQKGNECKHKVYALSTVLRAPYEYQYQRALLSTELKVIFDNAPPIPTDAVDSDDNKAGTRKPVDGECPICYMDFDQEHNELVWCKAACGNNMHKTCFDQWAASQRGNTVKCVYCRTPWEMDRPDLNAITSTAVLNDEGYVNVAQQFHIPASPSEMDWLTHFPAYVVDMTTTDGGVKQLSKQVTVADIGCGFGGLLVALSPVLREDLIVGMELRNQVLDYVHSRIQALRSQQQSQQEPQLTSSASPPFPYQNISALRTNTMKFLPNFFPRASLRKIFICFPDPHFKQRKHKARIVSSQLNAEYAYVLQPGVGKVYTITDVEELHYWMVNHFEGRDTAASAGGGCGGGIGQLFERVSDDENARDECVRIMSEETEEGKKVSRNNGKKFIAVWKRRLDPEWEEEEE
ncbi:hypothetical protein DV736_g6217, partial [Chaetothyriales sp. CBS 134916]